MSLLLEELEKTLVANDRRISVLAAALHDIIEADQQSDIGRWGQGKVDGPCAAIARKALSARQSD